MKNFFTLVIVMFIIYLLFQIGLTFFLKGHTENYSIANGQTTFFVKEDYSYRNKTGNNIDRSNYHITIAVNKEEEIKFSFKIIKEYNNFRRIIKDIKVYSTNNMICIYPVLSVEEVIDVLCNMGEYQVNYNNIKGTDKNLDSFVSELAKEEGVRLPNDASDVTVSVGKNTVYKDNIANDINLVIWNYKGVTLLNKNVTKNIDVNEDDDYQNKLGVLVGENYFIPEYHSGTQFIRFHKVDVLFGSSMKVDLEKPINFSSYIQGVVANNLYIFDESNLVQYKIDIDKEKVEVVGNVDINAKYYEYGTWTTRNIYDFTKEKLIFKTGNEIPSEILNIPHYIIEETGGNTDGFYYLYKKDIENDTRVSISVYRYDKKDTRIPTLLFKTYDISNMKYVKDYILYMNDDTLYGYSDRTGIVPLVINNEFEFNKNNVYDVYVE